MKQILLFLLLIVTVLAHSQAIQPTTPVVQDRAFMLVEQMPEYPGGEVAMTAFIQKNLVYPKYARKHNIQGRIVIGFIVNADGSISDIDVKKSVDPHLDAEAIRLVKLFPNFKPGRQQGKNVRVNFVLPIMFKLAS